MRDLKSWTSHTLFPSGSIVIDDGAYHVLSRRESGGRLLAAGVVDVIGAFASGQAVRIVVRKAGVSSPANGNAHGRDALSYEESWETTRPPSPATAGAPSSQLVSGIVSSIGPKVVPEENVVPVERKQLSEDDVVEVGRGLANYNSEHILQVKGLKRFVNGVSLVIPVQTEPDGSSQIPPILGYADSEYVAENITIRVPPAS